jgi:hypothetical protein
LVEGHLRKNYGHGKPLEQWEVLLKDHHEGYIEWTEFERNQALLAANAYGKAGGAKSGRGGRALLAGLLSCGRCGRRLPVVYVGKAPGRPVYRCDRPNLMLGLPRCLGFGGSRIDAAIAAELLRALQPMAVEAALQAERVIMESQKERHRVAELLQQARYEAALAERRYAACDPDNRLIAAQLEKNWETALRRVNDCQARLDAGKTLEPSADAPDLMGLASDLSVAWNAPGTTMRTRQRLARALIKDIVADVDDEVREVVLTIHWKDGQHSQLRIKKPKTGEHGRAMGRRSNRRIVESDGHAHGLTVIWHTGRSPAHSYGQQSACPGVQDGGEGLRCQLPGRSVLCYANGGVTGCSTR